MAGKFRGEVGRLTKPKMNKSSKRMKGKKVVALVKRSRKLDPETLQSRIAQLTSSDATTAAASRPVIGAKVAKSSAKGSAGQSGKVPVGKAALEVVGKGKRERVVPEKDVAVQRTTAEAVGLKILHQAVKNQSHGRLLEFQKRHDYEYRLRSVATMGVVQLFNSLAQSRKASAALDADEARMTADKITEKKQVASKEAFLAALRQPQQH